MKAITMSHVMLAHNYEESRVAAWPQPFLVQPKLDGIRCIATVGVADDGQEEIYLRTRNDKPITSCPHIIQALAKLDFPLGTVLDGELLVPNKSFQEICSFVKRKTLHQHFHLIEYHIFDVISDFPQENRLFFLWNYLTDFGRQCPLPEDSPCHLVHWKHCCREEISLHLRKYIAHGYEGIILRHPTAKYEFRRSPNLLKLKPTQTDMFRCVDFYEEVSIDGELKNTLGALVCVSPNNERFSVGSGFTRAQRKDFWINRDELIGSQILVKYQELTNRGVPRFPIFIRFVT